MDLDVVVEMGRLMLQEVAILIAPILLAAIAVSLLVNLFRFRENRDFRKIGLTFR